MIPGSVHYVFKANRMVRTEIVRSMISMVMTGMVGYAKSSFFSNRKGRQIPPHTPATVNNIMYMMREGQIYFSGPLTHLPPHINELFPAHFLVSIFFLCTSWPFASIPMTENEFGTEFGLAAYTRLLRNLVISISYAYSAIF